MTQDLLKSLNILLADASPHVRHLLKAILASLGAQKIVEVADGAEAFKEMRHFRPDLVFCDMVMSPLDGIDFTHLVRNGTDSPAPFVPIIMVSAYTERNKVFAARDAGVNEFVAKPVSATIISRHLHATLTAPRSFVLTRGFFGPDRRRHPDASFRGTEHRSEQGECQIFHPSVSGPPSEWLYMPHNPPTAQAVNASIPELRRQLHGEKSRSVPSTGPEPTGRPPEFSATLQAAPPPPSHLVH